MLLVPFVPRSFDVWTLEKVAGVVAEVQAVNGRLVAYAFLNRADARGRDSEEAAAVIRETPALTFLDTPLGSLQLSPTPARSTLAVRRARPRGRQGEQGKYDVAQRHPTLYQRWPRLS